MQGSDMDAIMVDIDTIQSRENRFMPCNGNSTSDIPLLVWDIRTMAEVNAVTRVSKEIADEKYQ